VGMQFRMDRATVEEAAMRQINCLQESRFATLVVADKDIQVRIEVDCCVL